MDKENNLTQDPPDFNLSEEYKLLMDKMLKEEENGEVKYVSLESIKEKYFK